MIEVANKYIIQIKFLYVIFDYLSFYATEKHCDFTR